LGERLYINSAYALATTGDTTEAVEFFKKALRRYPDSKSAMQLLSNIYFRSQRFEDLLSLLDGWIVTHPDDRETIVRREEIRAAMGAGKEGRGKLGG